MIKVFNPYDRQVTVGIVREDGTEDGIHIQSGAEVKLPFGAQLSEQAGVTYPRLRIVDTTVVGSNVITEGPKTVVSDKQGAK